MGYAVFVAVLLDVTDAKLGDALESVWKFPIQIKILYLKMEYWAYTFISHFCKISKCCLG